MESESESSVEEFLHSLLHKISSCDVPTVENASEVCNDFCRYLSLYPKLATMIGDILATLGREESFRVEAGKSKIMSTLVNFLSSPDEFTRLQIVRAIGNLCIDNDSNRESILKAGGCHSLTEEIKKCHDSSYERYKWAVCGCVLNLATDNDKLAQEFLLQGALEGISLMLSIPNQSEIILMFGLQVLCVLTETANLDDVEYPMLLETVTHIISQFKEDKGDYLKHALELTKILIDNENENVALKLIECGIVRELLQIEQVEMEQKAMDLIVLLLGKDKCMEVLFEDGEILMVAKEWLESTIQIKKANASLMIANIARSDSNCLKVIQKGFVQLLIETVMIEETEAMMGKLHHAALSALRNLSLPTQCKEKLFSMGVIDSANYALKTSTLSHDHFKALGIMRLLVDGQEMICSHVVKEAIEHICEVCKNTSTSHIHIEAGRLLSALVKYCKDESIMLRIIRQGGIKWIYLLLGHEQAQLISEGLMALNIIAVVHNEEMLLAFYNESNSSIIDHICSNITSSFPLNVINNSLILVKTLLSKESSMKQLLENSLELKITVQKLISHDNEEVRINANELCKSLTI